MRRAVETLGGTHDPKRLKGAMFGIYLALVVDALIYVCLAIVVTRVPEGNFSTAVLALLVLIYATVRKDSTARDAATAEAHIEAIHRDFAVLKSLGPAGADAAHLVKALIEVRESVVDKSARATKIMLVMDACAQALVLLLLVLVALRS
jgi:hypothetical protein